MDIQRLERLAASGDRAAASELLAAARRQNDRPLAARAAAFLGAETTLVELAEQAWKEDAWADLRATLAALGLGVEQAQVERLARAVAGVNGRRRTHLLTPRDVITCALAARRGEAARHPSAARTWQRRAHTRGFCEASVGDGGAVLIEIGSEAVRSCVKPIVDAGSVTRVALEVVAVIEPAAAAGAAPVPIEVSQGFDWLRSVEPSYGWMARAVERLKPHVDAPFYPTLIERVEAYVRAWTPEERCGAYSDTPSLFKGPHRRLFRGLRQTWVGFLACVDAAAPEPLDRIERLELCDLNNASSTSRAKGSAGGRGDAAVDGAKEALARADVLVEALPGLRDLTLTLSHPDAAALARLVGLALPEGLERLRIDHAFTPAEQARVVERLAALARPPRCYVSSLWMQDPARDESLEALRAVPEATELHMRHVQDEASVEVLERGLGARRLDAVEGFTEQGKGQGLYAALASSGLAQGLGAVAFIGSPGQLTPLLARGAWPRLTRVSLKQTYYQGLLHRVTPEGYTFAPETLEALVRCPAFGQLTSLELYGIIGEAGARRLAEAAAQVGLRLERLTLQGSRIGNAGLAALARAGVLRSVRHLDLRSAGLTGKGAAVLASEHGPQGLETLVLARNSLSKPAYEALAGWQGLSAARRIDLRELRPSAENRQRLMASPWIAREAFIWGG